MQQNFLSPTGFKFTLKRLPHVTFFVQTATIPGLTMTTTDSPTPFRTMFFAGDKVEFGEFTMTMRVDEYMESYNEIFNWMIGLTKPDSFDQFKDLKSSEYGLYSDATLTILNSKGNAGIEVIFKNMFPIALGEIEMDAMSTDVAYRTCTITFKHNGHTVKRI